MKVSKREATLLSILGMVLISVIYYQLVYVKQIEKIEKLELERIEVQTKYDTVMTTIRSIDEKKGEIKVYNANIEEKSKEFYPKLIQENIILEIDKLLKSSNIDASLSFSPVSIAAVEVVNVQESSIGESTLGPIVDEYNQYLGEKSEDKVSAGSEDVVSSGNTVEQFKVNMSYSGTYKNLKKLIDLVNDGDRKIIISNIAISQKNDKEVSGSLSLEFYGVPKLNKADEEYLVWTLNNKYGKDTPFSNGGATGGTIESTLKPIEKYDFIMTTKPINSDLPTVMIGKANDSENTSYIYADNKGIENVELEITKNGSNYYYKYKLSTGSYPAIYSGKGQMFTPVGDSIVFEILSKSRLDANDLAGVDLTIINNSNKVIEVNISDDDKENPRVIVKSEGNAVKVNKK